MFIKQVNLKQFLSKWLVTHMWVLKSIYWVKVF